MYKIKATKKEMKQNLYIIGIGYCGAQNLLKALEPIAYSKRAEGWACDYYDIDDVIISTGYSYLDNKRTKYKYEDLRKIELKADAIWSDYNITYKQRANKVKRLLVKFINKSIENYKNNI